MPNSSIEISAGPVKRRRIKTSITLPDGLMEDPLMAVVMKRRYVGNFSELVTRLIVEDLERAKEVDSHEVSESLAAAHSEGGH